MKAEFHDNIIGELEKRLIGEDRTVFTEHEYICDGQHEADILVIPDSRKYAYVIEVKSRNSKKAKKKARWQLDYDEKYINENYDINKVFKFYAYAPRNNKKKRAGEYFIKLIQ